MKILIVVNHAGFFLSHRLPIAVAAKARGWDVHIATPRSKHVPRIEAAGLRWHPIRLSRSGLNVFAELRTIFDLFRLYRSLRPDVVHHVTTKPVLYGTFAARLARIPAVVNALAGLGHVFYDSGANRLLRGLVLAAYSFALRHPNVRFIFQNDDDRDVFLRRRWVRSEAVTMIRGSGVDAERFAPALRNRSDDRQQIPPTVILASRLLYTKGVPEFVEAARRLEGRARFVVVGEPDPDNPGSIPLAQLQAWAGEGSVEYWGRREDMHEVLAAADVFCLPTYYREGVPKAVIEAASCGLPVVTTDTPGCRDIVRDGENGLLVPPRDVDALVRALDRLLADPALRRRMGDAGRARVLRDFSLPQVVDATLRIYEELRR
jgi:glycosyltransferase involved in cell wall biosynthesis